MSKILRGGQSWTDLTEERDADAIPVWRARALDDIAEITAAERLQDSLLAPAVEQHSDLARTRRAIPQDPLTKDKNFKQRFGLPTGFVSRRGRYGRTMLFEDNVYRLPNGHEFIPQPPKGTLGSRNHRYALLTTEQYVERQRGSVYVRTDGRIFDYACDQNVPDREMFDTGFTIHDLERTGRYAPELKSRSVKLRRRGKQKRARKRKLR